ncbi:hypothetical protein E2493_15650 [Sphingomonas parva]|uniref:Uncharacterized protein n=1 Tax=Sphingomonas parva TaxID=2555898 RepID=A0A4Y8ZPW6_9SPHN|nr:hypothetical protein [Sphingomonas parva]TFI57302.1 hypothetical protein E2493_15650 [Sphingomonas parva]
MFTSLAIALALGQAAPQPLKVLEAEFYAFDADDPDRAEATRIVPYVPETSCFGWEIRVPPADRTIRVREVLILPAPPRTWNTDESITTISTDRRRAETELEQDLSEGMLSNDWCIADGDPLGRHRIEVYEGRRLLRRFDFQVVLTVRLPSISSTNSGTSTLAAPIRVSWK